MKKNILNIKLKQILKQYKVKSVHDIDFDKVKIKNKTKVK